jgi:hypothetical protein
MKAKTVNETINGVEILDTYVKASKHVPDHPLTLVKKTLIKEFQQKRGVKPSLGIGRKHKMEFPNGYEVEGPLENKDRAESLKEKLDQELLYVQQECEEEEIYDDHQMDILDEVVEEYMEEFRKLGYDYTEDWK